MERKVSIRLLNQQTSAVVAEVCRGQPVTITSAGRPVARMIPLSELPAGLTKLVELGVAKLPSHGGPLRPPPRTAEHRDIDIAAALERDRGADPW